jgi:predicted GNAT family acetyltransferase
MQIQHRDSDTKGVFFIEQNGLRVGEMTYVHAGPGKIIIDHTEVDPSQGGKGIGKKLVLAGVEYARKNNLKIVPVCPYAKKVLEGAEEYADVVF